jgi:FixJ family two-component response regulator
LEPVSIISIIDDDTSARVAARNLVRSLGFTVHTFASAEEFLRSASLKDSSCIISDVQMPKIDGLQLQEMLAVRGYKTPLILVTAFPTESVERRALAAGAACFLSKPLEANCVMRCIKQALASHDPDADPDGAHR